MVSDFRKKKLLHIFNAFFDTDRSGAVNKTDFELAIQKFAEMRGLKVGDARYKEIEELVMKIWDGLQKQGDADNDGEISQDEWVEMWDNFSKNPKSAAEWQNLYCKFIFQFEDATNDGAFDVDEFSSVYVAFGLDREESIQAFHKIAKGKDQVTWPEFQELWTEYFTSEDPKAPGNFIFGCYMCSLSKHAHSHSN